MVNDNQDTRLGEAQKILDRDQIAFLGANPDRSDLSAWFNACLNSACGPVGEKYGDIGVYGLLHSWMETVKKRIEAKDGKVDNPR